MSPPASLRKIVRPATRPVAVQMTRSRECSAG
jgi:hypothetical protein